MTTDRGKSDADSNSYAANSISLTFPYDIIMSI